MNKKYMNEDGTPFSKEQFIEKIKTDKEFSDKFGNLGPIYGKQWRSWEVNEPKEVLRTENVTWSYEPNPHTYQQRVGTFKIKQIDQIANLISELKTNPDSRRLMVLAYNVGELDQMVLPPCHYGFQVYTRNLTLAERIKVARSTYPNFNIMDFGHSDGISEEEFQHQMLNEKYPELPQRAISLMWSQRSCDVFLGLPFNIASYGLLLSIIAKEVNMIPDQLIGNLGDTHLYLNHLDQAKEQLGREMTTEERMDWWFKNNKPNRDVCDAVDDMPDNGKNTIFDISSPPVPRRTREPFALPTLRIKDEVKRAEGDCLPAYSIEDFFLENYQSHPAIKAPLSN